MGLVVPDADGEGSYGDVVDRGGGHLASHAPSAAPASHAHGVELGLLSYCGVIGDEDVGLLGIGDLLIALGGKLLFDVVVDALIHELVFDGSSFGPGVGVVVGEVGSVIVVGGDLLREHCAGE